MGCSLLIALEFVDRDFTNLGGYSQITTNQHVSMKFLRTVPLTKLQVPKLAQLQRRMLRSIVGRWVEAAPWNETMGPTKQKIASGKTFVWGAKLVNAAGTTAAQNSATIKSALLDLVGCS